MQLTVLLQHDLGRYCDFDTHIALMKTLETNTEMVMVGHNYIGKLDIIDNG